MSPVTALTYERELIEIRLLAQKLDSDLSLAKSQLAALMDIPPGTNFTLAGDGTELPSPAMLDLSGKEMIAEALFNRAEIRELEYKRRINDGEVAAALLELLPGLQVYTGDNLSSNSFLLTTIGPAGASRPRGTSFEIAQLPAKYRAIDAQDDLLDQQALAMTMVVMTQVYVSRIRYSHFVKELEIARNYDEVQEKLTAHVRAEAAAGRVSEQILIREEMNAIVADVKHDIALANMHTGAANVFASMGLDLQADEIDHGLDVKTLASHLRHAVGGPGGGLGSRPVSARDRAGQGGGPARGRRRGAQSQAGSHAPGRARKSCAASRSSTKPGAATAAAVLNKDRGNGSLKDGGTKRRGLKDDGRYPSMK